MFKNAYQPTLHPKTLWICQAALSDSTEQIDFLELILTCKQSRSQFFPQSTKAKSKQRGSLLSARKLTKKRSNEGVNSVYTCRDPVCIAILDDARLIRVDDVRLIREFPDEDEGARGLKFVMEMRYVSNREL